MTILQGAFFVKFLHFGTPVYKVLVLYLIEFNL